MQDRIEKSKMFLFCALIGVLGIFFLGNPSMEDLKFAQGRVSNVVVKENKVGFFLEMKPAGGGEKIILNIEGISRKAIDLISNFKGGDPIQVWYTDFILTKYDSVDPWRVESDGIVIISYQESQNKNIFYRYSFGVMSLLFAIPGLWFLAKGE